MSWKTWAIALFVSLTFAASESRAQSAQYGYDALGRLTSVTYANGSATTYTYDAAGNRTQVTTTVPAVSATLSASPTTINQGASTTLTWSTANATSASINNGVGSVTPVSGGTRTVSPSVTTTYTLTATGASGSTTSSATVTVNDISPTPWTWANQSISTASSTGTASTPVQTLSGFNTPVNLRVSASSITGNISAATYTVLKNGSSAGALNFIANPTGYVDVTVQPGDTLQITTNAQSAGGTSRSGSALISVRNLSDGSALLSSFTLSMAVGTNDYSVNPWAWSNLSINSPATYSSTSSTVVTLGGFNQPVTLRVATPAVTPGGLNAGGLYALRNSTTFGNYNFISNPAGYVDVPVVVGDTLNVFMDAHAWSGATTGSANVTVRNLSDSNALLSSFVLNIALGPDYSVNPWTWPTQNISTTNTYGSVVTPVHTLSGFNQTVTLRVSTSSITGNISAAGIYLFKNNAVQGNYNFIANPSGYVDLTVDAGNTIHIYLDAQSWVGPATGSATISIRNLSDGNALVSSFTLNMAVSQ